MASKWSIVRLGDYVDSSLGKMLDAKKNKGELQPYLGNSNVRWGQFDLSELAQMKFESHEEKRYGLRDGDLVVCEGGEPGRCAIWRGQAGMKIQKALHRVRGKDGLSNEYLCYWLSFAVRRGLLEPFFTGTTIKHLTGRALAALEVPLPPPRAQQAMIEVLRPLDDRIDNLRQTNTTLEAIAQALFKSWFVDFDPVRAKAEGREPEGMDSPTAALFPGEFEDSELGPIPKGWRRVSFGEVAQQGKGSINPLAHPDQRFHHYSLPAFDSGQLPVVEPGDAIKSNKTPVPSGAVLVSKLNPHIPRVWFVGEADTDAVCSTEFLVWTPRAGLGSAFVYCLASSSDFNTAMRQLVTGTSNSHQRVKPSQLAMVQAAVVSDDALASFEAIAAPILQQVEHNRRQAGSFAALRDTLLPRLISGKLRLPEAEALADEVA